MARPSRANQLLAMPGFSNALATSVGGAASYRVQDCHTDGPRKGYLSNFTNDERARLRSYRRAIRAGFYSDWDGSASG
jgi:hypothetical protein